MEQEKGILTIAEDNSVRSFREKKKVDSSPINAGYMVLEPEIFEYIKDDDCVFEKDVLPILADEGELMSYRHEGFWQCMDTKREQLILENMWISNNAPWKKW